MHSFFTFILSLIPLQFPSEKYIIGARCLNDLSDKILKELNSNLVLNYLIYARERPISCRP